MSKDKEAPAHGLIESAMGHVARGHEDPDKKSTDSPWRSNPGSDAALSHRLDQLKTALGSDTPAAPSLSALTNHREPGPPQRLGSSAAGHGPAYGPGTIVLAGGASALAGAGLMWLAMGGADHRSLPAPVTPAALVSIVPETTTMPPPETAAPIATPRLPLHEDDRQARNLVERWRQAWATRNVDAYLGSYSADFSPAKGQTHANWAAARRAKLLAQTDISVQVHQMSIERINNHQLKVGFLQDYASGNYRETAQPKTLLLIRTGNDWRIAGEWQSTDLPRSATRK